MASVKREPGNGAAAAAAGARAGSSASAAAASAAPPGGERKKKMADLRERVIFPQSDARTNTVGEEKRSCTAVG
jgi:hypothetical protein